MTVAISLISPSLLTGSLTMRRVTYSMQTLLSPFVTSMARMGEPSPQPAWKFSKALESLLG
jgi:hypothetical protein